MEGLGVSFLPAVSVPGQSVSVLPWLVSLLGRCPGLASALLAGVLPWLVPFLAGVLAATVDEKDRWVGQTLKPILLRPPNTGRHRVVIEMTIMMFLFL